MTTKLETLEAALRNALGDHLQSLTVALGEITVLVKAADYLSAMLVMRDHADLRFEELIDLCGLDYSTYGDGAYDGPRFAVVSHLLSMKHNW
ncbi:MAG: NADH-quinone oxidoreductase subunit C, partial [Oxalobacteraceae bacterium]